MPRSRMFLLLLLVCLALMPVFARLSSANLSLRIDETLTKVSLHDGQSEITLAVENPSAQEFTARVSCELLDPQDRVRASAERDALIGRGTDLLKISLTPSLTGANKEEPENLLWYRLRYRVAPVTAENSAIEATQGVISLSGITPSFFELRVSAPNYMAEGASYTARVRATHPLLSNPVGGVSLKAEIELDTAGNNEAAAPVTTTGTTDADGYATLVFHLPREIKAKNAQLKIYGQLDDFTQEAESEIHFDRAARIMINTDKPLYQPGQMMHVRALVFTARMRAAAATPLSLTIYDSEGAVVFRSPLVTSRFGVASQDWQIPESLKLGDYRVNISTEDESYGNSMSDQEIRISRYDLPNFVVNIKPDKPYYLPGQDAEISVSADYLFGQPVARGHVRVVREAARYWNYQAQKWETKEEETYEGETDEAGRFTAHINLTKEHMELREEDRTNYHDLSYAAYFTDPTTTRTEQRRFDLRVTKEAIHVYLVKDNFRQANGFPTQFYLTASYADGLPAPACEVTIRNEDDDETTASASLNLASFTARYAHRGRTLPARVVTNRFGVAKVGNLTLHGLKDDETGVTLKLIARDKKGLTGSLTEEFEHADEPVIRVATDKILYRAGEPLRAQITASQPDMTVIVDVVRDWRVIRSERVRLAGGSAFFAVPYDEHFKGTVSIIAYSDHVNEMRPNELASRSVLYPIDDELKVDVRLDRQAYRPGEDARAEFQVNSWDGRPVESALGVVVFDRAVEERARTDDEFSANRTYGFSLSRWGSAVAGLQLEDFMRADRRRPLPAELELVGEILLAHAESYYPAVFSSYGYNRNQQRWIFNRLIEQQLQPVKGALGARYADKSEYPSDEQSLVRYLSDAGVSFKDLRDPWGTPYRAAFGWSSDNDMTEIICAGADKLFETSDDFTVLQIARPYFRPLGEKLNRVAENYHRRTGGFIRDAATLKAELQQQEGLDFDSLRDRRGKPYQLEFGLSGASYTINIKSRAAASSYDQRGVYVPAEFNVWTTSQDYFMEMRVRLNDALAENLRATGHVPRDEKEIWNILLQSGVEPKSLRDVYGHDYYCGIRSWSQNSDHVSILYRTKYGEALRSEIERKTASYQYYFIYLKSKGRDGVAGTNDDFPVGAFYHSTAELDYLKANPLLQQAATLLKPATGNPNGEGNLQGTVFDPNQAVVAGAVVSLIDLQTGAVRATTTNEEGIYRFAGLRAFEKYTIRAWAAGFAESIVEQIPVFAGAENRVDVSLEVAAASEYVTVTGESAVINSTQSQMSTTYTARQLTQLPLNGSIDNLALLTPGIVSLRNRDFVNGVGISANGSRRRSNNFQIDGEDNNDGTVAGQISTPRLREYFPETLLWQPSLETDASGRALLNFKLADNITTWKLSVIGSTMDGQIGIAQKEIRAFQPFFIEHDPPRVLTAGDRIDLPVVLRNYLKQPQTVDVEMKPESWFALVGASSLRETVKAGDSTRAVFSFLATATVKDGKQRVTATGADEASDAVEKPVSVHPDGEEITETRNILMDEAATMELNYPSDAIPDSARAELRIYPGLMSHVIESIEGIMQRPYGCGEQTISSTYPSLLALRAYKRSGISSPVKAKAARYLKLGYERLLNYRAAGGGFTYWGRGEADLALTAYALRFLNDAREFVAVDEKIIAETRQWLLTQQRADGSWPDEHYSAASQDVVRDSMLTAYISYLMMSSERGVKDAGVESEAVKNEANKDEATRKAAIARAFDYLRRHEREVNEPYFSALYALAAIEGGEPERAAEAIGKLRAQAQEEGDESFWSSESPTPFHDWGLAGRIEISALAVKALKRFDDATRHETQAAGLEDGGLASRGLLYLLRNKDRYGVWHSTQATINVLDALVASISESDDAQGGIDEAEITVNGQRATSVELPPAKQLSGPLSVDLTPYLMPGNNSISIRRAGAKRPAAVQAVQTYYVPWNSASSSSMKANAASRALRLAVSFDKTEASRGEEVTCTVEAGRVGASAGYGMMLAEIGLPPGADVDRASLEKAMTETGWSLSRYDVLPDRVVVYLWPSRSSTRFQFKFRTRFGLSAQTAPSVLYDYYNPGARTVIAPTKFTVK